MKNTHRTKFANPTTWRRWAHNEVALDPCRSNPIRANRIGDVRKRNLRQFLQLGHVSTAPGEEHVAISR